MMDNRAKGFVFYEDYREYFSYLSKEEKGDLMDAIFAYGFEGEEPEGLSKITALVFAVIRNQIERDKIKYGRKCESNRKNGALGGRPRKEPCEEKAENKATAEKDSGAKERDESPCREEKGEKVANSEDFQAFWEEYPRKVGQHKARDVFMEIGPDGALLERMLKTLAWQKESEEWKRDGGRYIPHCAKWLSDKRWEDEPVGMAERPSSFSTDEFFAASLARAFSDDG